MTRKPKTPPTAEEAALVTPPAAAPSAPAKRSTNEEVENVSDILSKRKWVLERLPGLLKGTRSDLAEMLPQIIQEDPELLAEMEGDSEFDRVRTTLQELRSSGVDVEALFRIDPFKEPSAYDTALFKSMLSIGRLERRIASVGTAKAFQARGVEKKTVTTVQSEGAQGSAMVQKFRAMREAAKRAESFANRARMTLDPEAQREVRGAAAVGKLQDELRSRVDSSYFDWLASSLLKMHGLEQSLRRTGKIVITPSMRKIIESVHMADSIGKVACLEGDLGSGKTELALHIGRTLNREHFANLVEQYEKEPGYRVVRDTDVKEAFDALSDDERLLLAKRAYAREVARAKNGARTLFSFARTEEEGAALILAKGKELMLSVFRNERFTGKHVFDETAIIEPIIISGHKDFDTTEMVGSIEITHEQLNVKELSRVYNEGCEEIIKISPAEDHAVLKDLLKDRVATGSMVETRAYLGRLFQAMKFGKVLILDEFNAIPHETLIVLNYYMTRKPADKDKGDKESKKNYVHPPVNGMDPFPIADGFKIIFTGNIPRPGQSGYVGRQQIDAAFLSRLDPIRMNYLPNTREDSVTRRADGTIAIPKEFLAGAGEGTKTLEDAERAYEETLSNEERAILRHGGTLTLPESGERKVDAAENNELFHVLATMGLPETLTGPLPKDYFQKLFQLARVSRILQDAFAGSALPSKYLKGTTKMPSTFMKRGVPSLRDLSTVVRAWQGDGFARPLDIYLWRYFVQPLSINPEEQQFVWRLYHEFGGFFTNTPGTEFFPQNAEALHTLELQGDLLKNEQIPREMPEVHFFSQHEIARELFGVPPHATETEQQTLDAMDEGKEDLEKLRREVIDEIDGMTIAIEAFVEDYKDRVLRKYCKGKCDLA